VIEYYFKATAYDGKEITRPLTAPEGVFRVEVEGTPTSLSDLRAFSSSMHVFPNPAGALTCVPVDLARAVVGTLALYDMHGRPVKQIYSGDFPAGSSKYFFDAGQMPAGYYVLDLRTTHDRISKAVVIR
jgi:hypothetical protein